ncbi:hypothetical protein OPT61_g5211 [Boeremia exigua]|uniref:Uncharacterized protein n=1 Tax=Boeremia exigua TaxID=749465 RepID=A0ACC2IB88_9PLEO|nr:hypothetical protein OPT61_g5211 [Boeremia exigua]
MSWSGPVAGATPYQTPPYTNGQPGYSQHPPHQYGQPPPYGQYQHGPAHSGPVQRSQDNRPPKKKGNPIITRYPPPPGYRGPAPQGGFHAHQHSAQYQAPSQPGFPSVPPAQSIYPGHGYNAAPPPQGYPSSGYVHPQASSYPLSYPQGQNFQWPQQIYQPNQAPHQTPAYPGTQGYGATSMYQPYPSQNAAADANPQAYNQVPGRPQMQPQTPYPPQSHYNGYSGPPVNDQPMSDPNATPTVATTHPGHTLPMSSTSTIGTPHNAASQKSELYLAWDDWDFDFDGAIWPKSNEPVDPNLSLGVIIWHPAKQATRALPATFEEAEEQSLRPTPEKLGNGESVSIYFTTENSHEAFLDVRQTDDWDYVKDDPAFVIFRDEEMQNNLVPIEDCIAQRDRPDERHINTEDAEMHEADWSVMDNLEQALSTSGEESKPTDQSRDPRSARPQTQDDILASLGVTGMPKPVSGDPMPFPMSSRPQIEPQRNQPLGHIPASNPGALPQRPYDSVSSIGGPPPPPPPPPGQDRYDPWNPRDRHQQYHANGFNGGRGSPARSEASNGTAAGSDFGVEKPTNISLTPGSKFERNDSSASRKRSYGDTHTDDDGLREHDDHTKRKRRSQVNAAYSRR